MSQKEVGKGIIPRSNKTKRSQDFKTKKDFSKSCHKKIA